MNVDALLREVDRIAERLRNRMAAIVQRAVVTSVSDGAKMQAASVELQDDDSASSVEHYQPGGLSHRAGAGAEGVYLAVGAENANGILVAVSRRGVRVKASMPGGTVLYAEIGSNAPVELKPDGTAGVLIGNDPQQAMVLGDALKSWLESHTHLTAMGPSGVPVTASALGATLSTKHKLDV